MKLFLSYPSTQRELADRLALALEAEGHDVFIDRSDLPVGQAFHEPLRKAIEEADAFVFLITPESVASGSYTMAELDIARERWRRPSGHVLPVVVKPTPIADVPPYLAAVTLLQPRGEIVAETVAAAAKLRGGRGRAIAIAAVLVVLALVAAGVTAQQLMQRRAAEQAAAETLRRDLADAAEAGQLCVDGTHELALARLGEILARQPAQAAVRTAREDCAMRWLREMRATLGQRTFGEQVAVVQPVLLAGLGGASGERAADLRAHIGWGEYLRGRDAGGSGGDPVPHWTRAVAEDAHNVYAQSMWGRLLLDRPPRVEEAKAHFAQALAGGRDRAWVRTLQFGGTLGSTAEAQAYAVTVADDMRRNDEKMKPADVDRLWRNAFGTRLLLADERSALAAALPPADLLATFGWLFPPGSLREDQQALWRFVQAMLQAGNGERDSARTGLQALVQELRAAGQDGRLLSEAQRALEALAPPARSAPTSRRAK